MHTRIHATAAQRGGRNWGQLVQETTCQVPQISVESLKEYQNLKEYLSLKDHHVGYAGKLALMNNTHGSGLKP